MKKNKIPPSTDGSNRAYIRGFLRRDLEDLRVNAASGISGPIIFTVEEINSELARRDDIECLSASQRHS